MKVTCPHCDHEFEVFANDAAKTPIRAARYEKGWTLARAATELEMSPHTLQALEQGRMNPRLTTIRVACRIYGKSIDELFPEAEEEGTDVE